MAATHKCWADNCNRQVPLRMLMCIAHWKLVPKHLQQDVWNAYTNGQEQDHSRINDNWKTAVDAAVRAVRIRENEARA